MKIKYLLALLLSSATTLSLGCGGGGECAQAYDKEIECGDHSDEEKKEMKKYRSEAISMCKKSKDKPRVKTAIACGKTKSCEEFKACELKAQSADDIEDVNKALAKNDTKEAMSECQYRLDKYNAVPEFAAVCDKAFAGQFAKLDDKKTLDDLRYFCGADDSEEWRKASKPLAEGCNTLLKKLKESITKQRDDGSEYDYSTCSGYLRLVKAMSKAETEAAELLCAEADISDDFTEGFAEVEKYLAEKKTSLPYRCSSLLDPKSNSDKAAKLTGSTWYPAKVNELAKVCYGGELAQLVLGEVDSYCLSTAKSIHTFAAKYALIEANPALKTLIEKTAEECSK